MPPLIHIGFHKTGSSLLQHRVFASSELGFCQPPNKSDLLHRAFILRDPNQPCEPEALALLQEVQQKAETGGKVTALSHERLSGYPASGGYDQFEIANRLVEGFPEAKILIVIREQCSAILSMYLQTISDGSALSLKEFLNPPETHIRRQPLFRPSFYAYDGLIQHYQTLFGEQQVKVLPFEWLQVNPSRFGDELLQFSGAIPTGTIDIGSAISSPFNPSLPLGFQLIRRQCNKVFRSQLANNGPINVPATSVQAAVKKIRPALSPLSVVDKPLKRRYQNLIDKTFDGVFSESNTKTELLTGMNLKTLGYQVSR